MKKFWIFAAVLAVLLLVAFIANKYLGVATALVLSHAAVGVIAWVVLPQPAIVTRFWAWLGMVDRA